MVITNTSQIGLAMKKSIQNNIESNTLFPIFVKLEKIHILLVGGGKVALEKLNAIYKCFSDSNLTIVGINISHEIRQLASQMPNTVLIEREFNPDDLENKQIVIAATDDRLLHEKISSVCLQKNILCNIADTPDLCSFYLGSIVHKGNLKIAISTNGKSPTVAKKIREVLEDTFPDEIETTLENLDKIRKRISGNFTEKVKKLNDLTSVLLEKE